MKVLLLKDVYKLGRAGDVKKVADGYGRNFLIPKGFATLATAGALKRVDAIKVAADKARAVLNSEMSSVAEALAGKVFYFTSKAGETGKLYGSVTTQMIADAIKDETGITVDRHQIEVAPIRMIGEHPANVRLTVDLVPEVTVVVSREGEVARAPEVKVEKVMEPEAVVEPEESAEVPADNDAGEAEEA